MTERTRVSVEHKWHGPHARCMSANCGFSAWRGELSWLSADEVRRLVRKHVRETGHPVEAETTSTTVYALESEPAKEDL